MSPFAKMAAACVKATPLATSRHYASSHFRPCARTRAIQIAAYAVAENSPTADLIIALNSLGSRPSHERPLIRMTFMCAIAVRPCSALIQQARPYANVRGCTVHVRVDVMGVHRFDKANGSPPRLPEERVGKIARQQHGVAMRRPSTSLDFSLLRYLKGVPAEWVLPASSGRSSSPDS